VRGRLAGAAANDDVRAVATDEAGAIYLTGGVGDTLTSLPCEGAADAWAGIPMGAGVLVAKLEPDLTTC
jgi:hypothetical protein